MLEMQALNRFIYKFKLGSQLNYSFFCIGLVAKIIAIYLLTSNVQEDLFYPFVSLFIDSNFTNPYSYFSSKALEPFPYPAGMLYFLSIPILIFQFILNLDHSLWIIKLPILICDLMLFFVIKSWLNHKFISKLIILYWLSPVLFYISYFYGQLDVIPISILFLSLYFLFRNNLKSSAMFLGLSLSTKTMIIIIIPFLVVFLISQRQNIKQIFLYLSIAIFTFFFINSYYFNDPSFYQMVFNNSTQGKVFDASISINNIDVYLLPIAYVSLFFTSLYIINFNKDFFITFLSFAMGIFLIFTIPSEGWFYWFLPFLFYLQAKNNFNSYFLIITLQFFYMLYFISEPTYPLYYDFKTEFLIISSSFSHIIYTILIASLILSCFWLYRYSLSNLASQKIFSIPFLVGIGGNSGSGKTKLSNALANVFGENHSLIINGDDLHKWERGDKNWDQFTHLDPRANELHSDISFLRKLQRGENIFRRKYNHSNGKFDAPKKITSSNLVFYEGLHPFFIKTQREVFDLKIFLNPPKSLNDYWKINRDTNERGKNESDVIKQIQSREVDSDAYILSQEKFANIIIEPICKDDNLNQDPEKYRIIFSNSLSLNLLINFFDSHDTIVLTHEYIDNDMQTLIISGSPNQDMITDFLSENILGLSELGILNSKVETSVYGLMILTVTLLIFEEAKVD